MKTVVTYQSKTGFTKKYAKWIADEISADLKDVSKISADEIKEYDLVIHGGWIMGGMIKGLNKVKGYNPMKLIVFGVGITRKEEFDVKKTVEMNKLGNTPFFYYEGGLNPSKMGFFGRTMVKMATKKTPSDMDHTSKDDIKELVKQAKEM